MQHAVPDHRILTFSQLSHPDQVHGVADIARGQRGLARQLGISGVLVFDGENLCEYLEGSAPAMQQLWAPIRRDPRRAQLQVLYENRGQHPRRFAQWSMAYVVDEDRPLQRMATLSGMAAVTYLLALQHRLDSD